jgi:SAM-dependent methyltransferase
MSDEADLPLDDPDRGTALRERILSKPALRCWYDDVYERYARVLQRCPPDGPAIELGAGVGFVRDRLPEFLAADLLPYDGLDLLCDARQLPFATSSVRCLTLLNVFHHIPDVAAFLREVERCLQPGGRLLIVDQYPGWLSRWILRYMHHEPFDPAAVDWAFTTTGPLSGANGALAWIVFHRDADRFTREFPGLTVVSRTRQSPLLYWLAGGLKRSSLVPRWLVPAVHTFDRWLLKLLPQMASFEDIEITRRG